MTKAFIVLALLSVTVSAQEKNYEWKSIKEMTGEIPNHPGLTIEVYSARIARGGDVVKLLLRADFPNGAPWDVFRDSAPRGFDISSVTRIESQIKLDCKALRITPIRGTARVYQFTGKSFKSKEPPFGIEQSHIFAQYFCEIDSAPTAPTSKPVLKRPSGNP